MTQPQDPRAGATVPSEPITGPAPGMEAQVSQAPPATPWASLGSRSAPDFAGPAQPTAAARPAPISPSAGAEEGAAHRGRPTAELTSAEPVTREFGSTGAHVATAPPRPRRRGVSSGVVVLLMLVSLLVGALLGVFGARLLEPGAADPASLPTSTTDVSNGGSAGAELSATSVAGIAERVLPSTVYIDVRTGTSASTGSGFVLREDGYVLTNQHVIASAVNGAGQVTVVFSDGSEEPAQIVGSTSDYDLAVLHVDRDGLEPLVLGDSDALVVGEPVVAIGAPLGLEGTVTSGIVSALNRPVTINGDDGSSFMNAIQTDAAINLGNSGGPLVNAAGEVIGVNSAIAATAGSSGSSGLGFAIPSTQVRRTAEQIINTGEATYPVIGAVLDIRYSGVGVQILSEDAADGTQAITPGGPAEQAGLQPGDVIVAMDGTPVTTPDELIVRIRAHAPGEVITLTLQEGDAQRDVDVTLGERASE